MNITDTTNTAGMSHEVSGAITGPAIAITTPEVFTPKKAPIEVSERGYLQAKNFDERWRLATAFFHGGMVPKSYKSIEQVFAGMVFAANLGLSPIVGLRNVAVINGQPSLWGDLPLGLCKKTGELESIEELIFDKDYTVISFANKNLNAQIFGSICRVKRKGWETVERWFTMQDATVAGLLNKDNVWRTYPRRMIQMRARSQALKDSFPDVLAGVSIAEYDFNTVPERDVTTINVDFDGRKTVDVAAEFNKGLNGGGTQ